MLWRVVGDNFCFLKQKTKSGSMVMEYQQLEGGRGAKKAAMAAAAIILAL